jgi:hypothetical protein
MKIYSLTAIFSIFLVFGLTAQHITGKVVDAKTSEPLPFANVFLNNTTIGTVTDMNGEFNLTSIKEPGVYELVFSFVGYETHKTKVTIGRETRNMGNIKLAPSEIELSTVEVTSTRDKEWERQLKKFKKIFLGVDKFAASCNIINPWVVDFPKETTGKKFLAKADAPIEILNEALGYKVFYYLTDFWSEKENYLINGNIRFEELKAADEKQAFNWAKNREKAYRRSYNYFFKMLLARNIKGVGFQLLYPNKNEESKMVLGFQDWVPYDTTKMISTGDHPGEFKVAMKGEFEIRNTKSWEVSRFEIKVDYIKVNALGFVLNPTDLLVSGVYDKNRVATLLPISYEYQNSKAEPGSSEFEITGLYEKIYINTNKPYYYPGEPMWFKGYINYEEPNWRDSLSKVMHVELINPKKEITLTKTLKIDTGIFYNDFILPDTLKAGTYFLRAYTNLNRNFGDSNLFIKAIPILNITDKVDHAQGKIEEVKSSLLTITSDKKTYKTREKITLTLSVKDKEGKPMAANLSISVTNAVQVVPIAEPLTIMNGYPFEKEKQVKATELKYPVEYGVGFKGKFVNDKGKPEKATLTILQMKPRNMMLAETDEQGIFSTTGLDFYDTATFSFKADKAKDHPYGKVELLPREVPLMDFKESNYNLIVQNTQSQQRIISEYEVPKNVRMLEAVEVKASRIEESVDRVQRPYGKPDYVLKEQDINKNYGNLLLALQGKFPGLIVRQTDGGSWIVYTKRGELSSMNNVKEITVMVNNVPMNGNPAASLFSINPETVESIEFTNRINVLYGSSSGFGIISIYTKQGVSEDALKVTPNFQSIKISGYSSSRKFRFPNYEDKNIDKTLADYRSTIYWNPEVVIDAKTGTATVSFFAADLPGKYRIVTEGVLQNGEAVRYVHFVEIAAN